MKKYSVAAILWDDHRHVSRSSLPNDIDSLIDPTLSVGLIVDETDKVIILASDFERYEDRDDLSYLVILKATIVNIKKFGHIKLEKPRRE